MTACPVTVDADDSLALAEAVIAAGNFRCLPVLQGERLIGLIGQRDLLRAWEQVGRAAARQTTIRAAMSTELVTVGPDAPAVPVARWMLEREVACLPVVQAGRLVGVVTAADFLPLAARGAGAIRRPRRPPGTALDHGISVGRRA